MSQPPETSSASGPTDSPAPGGSSPLVPLFLTVLVDVLALSIMLPLLPFMATRFGASPLVADLLFASFSACQFISGPILGRLSDRFGRKPTLLASQFGTFVGLLVLAFAQRIELLFIARMIDGLTAGNLSIAQAYITDVTRPENRTRAYGLIGFAFAIGFLIGPAASGILAEKVGYSVPPLVAAGLSLLSVILTVTLLPARKPRPATGPRPSRAELLRRYFAAGDPRGRLLEMFLFIWAFSTLTSGLALVLKERMGYGIQYVAYCFAYTAVVGGAVTGALRGASKRFGEHRLSVVGLVFMIAGYVVLAYADSLALLLVALGIGSIGSTVVRPALTTMLTSSVPESEHGLALGISQAMNAVAMTFAPIVGGLLITNGDYALWALVAAAFAIGAIGVRFVTGPGATGAPAVTGSEKKTSGPVDV